MAGHSKWAQIKHKKALTDAKKGQLFSKMVREVMVSVREGGASPDANPRLRNALERAKSSGVPKENIERAVRRATGKNETATLQEFLYEAVGPDGVYILIEGITDNRNRTLSEVKPILARYGAKLVAPHSLLWNFDKIWLGDGKDYRPQTPLELPKESWERIVPLLDALVDHDDVQEVYTNLKE